jgi:hypothetical protein
MLVVYYTYNTFGFDVTLYSAIRESLNKKKKTHKITVQNKLDQFTTFPSGIRKSKHEAAIFQKIITYTKNFKSVILIYVDVPLVKNEERTFFNKITETLYNNITRSISGDYTFVNGKIIHPLINGLSSICTSLEIPEYIQDILFPLNK